MISTLSLMDNEHLVCACQSAAVTPLERLLAERLEAQLEDQAANRAFARLSEDYGVNASLMQVILDAAHIEPKELVLVLDRLDTHGICTRAELEEELELARNFRALASDAGEIFDRLNSLATATQE